MCIKFFQRIEYFLILLLLGLCLTSHQSLYAQDNRPKIGLVLSGGGAKGVAHIGVLKVIEEAGLPIDYICGTSMGAIVGGLYSIGYSANELDSIVRAQDWMSLFSDKIDRTHRSYQSKIHNDLYLLSVPFNLGNKLSITQPTGIMKGQSILNKFSDLTLGYHDVPDFKKLPIPFTCIAADLISGKEIVMDHGSLPLAMRSSMSVPGFFEPICKDSMVMIDGGVLNNFPVDVVQQMGADIVIGIDLSCADIEEPKYQSLLDIANRIAFLSGENKYELNRKEVDLYINPELKGFESVDFKPSAIDSMINMGETAARKSWNKLVKLKKSLKLKKNHIYPARKLVVRTDSLHIHEMYIKGLSSFDENWLKRKVGFQPDCNMVYSDIENIIWTLQGMDLFKTVSYKVVNHKGKSSLYVFVEEKARGSINIGMHIDTEDVASALLQAQTRFGTKNQHKITATTKVNQNPWFNLSYNRSNKKMRNLGLTYNLSYKDFRLMYFGERLYNINFLKNYFKINFKDYSFKNLRYDIGIHYDMFSNVSDLYTPDYVQTQGLDEDYLSCYFKLDYDTTDDRETPTKGVNLTAYLEFYGTDMLHRNNYYFGAASFNVGTVIPISEKFAILPEFYGRVLIGENIPGYYCNYMGGEYNFRYVGGQHAFYGVHFTEIMDNSMFGTTWNFRYRLFKKHYVSCIGNVLLNSHQPKDIFQREAYYGGAIKYTYNSMIGPVSASIDYSNRSKKIGFFAGIGYFF